MTKDLPSWSQKTIWIAPIISQILSEIRAEQAAGYALKPPNLKKKLPYRKTR